MGAQYDLTAEIAQYLDKHMVVPLLDFQLEKNNYPVGELMAAKYDLLKKTKMVDFAATVYQDLHDTQETPQELLQEREKVLEELSKATTAMEPMLEIIQNEEVISQLKQDKLHNIQFLQNNFEFNMDWIPLLHAFAKIQYEIGAYGTASDLLYHFIILSTDFDKNVSALWGKLASEILTNNLAVALEDLTKLREMIDQKNFVPPLQQLQQRNWLLHWSLFIFFNHSGGREALIDMYLQPQYMSTIQTSCPHILRYLVAAVLTNRKRSKSLTNELVKLISQEVYQYQDPITEFITCLYVDFDFDRTQEVLKRCEEVLANDFFLVSMANEFMDAARLAVFETYCKVHATIDIPTLSAKLNMSVEDGERWIVKIGSDAKIDSEAGTVIMQANTQSVFDGIIERTKGLTFRSHVLVNAIERASSQQNNTQHNNSGNSRHHNNNSNANKVQAVNA